MAFLFPKYATQYTTLSSLYTSSYDHHICLGMYCGIGAFPPPRTIISNGCINSQFFPKVRVQSLPESPPWWDLSAIAGGICCNRALKQMYDSCPPPTSVPLGSSEVMGLASPHCIRMVGKGPSRDRIIGSTHVHEAMNLPFSLPRHPGHIFPAVVFFLLFSPVWFYKYILSSPTQLTLMQPVPMVQFAGS